MSIPSVKVAPVLVAKEAITAELPTVSQKRPRSRPYKARVSTKIKWALGDTMEKTISAQRTMRLVSTWLQNEKEQEAGNDGRLARLGDLSLLLFGLALDVSEMERIVRGALGESRPEDSTDQKN
jgi:hypothetical protein